MKYANRNALILGAGRTGGRAAIVDERWPEGRLAEVGSQGIRCLRATRDYLPDGAYDLIVASPSIPMDHPWLDTARTRGLHVISELELGAAAWQGDTLAVTGSKGKSSVVKCLVDALRAAGRDVCDAGNYGTPLSQRALERPDRGAGAIAVVEASSFQLELTRTFAPRLAAILNIQADHLDRHGTLEAYAAAKYRLFQAQRPPEAHAFLPPDLPGDALPDGVPLLRFGLAPDAAWRYDADSRTVRHEETAIPVSGYFANPILGSAAALIAAMLTHSGLTPEQIAAAFADFQPLPHRMQRVGETASGVAFIDDSKGTSLSATQAALRIVGHGVRLIAGGQLKERDLAFLLPDLRAHAVKVYLIGEAAQTLHDAWRETVPCALCGDLPTAFHSACDEAQPGETLLLSPGCASFDQFPGMAARGDAFQILARAAIEDSRDL